MLFFIFILSTFLSLLFPKSKFMFYSYLFLLWFIAAFCTQCADRNVYIARYFNYVGFQKQTEYGFNVIMLFFNSLKVPFDYFLMIIYGFILGIYAWFIRNNTDRFSFVLGLYGIFSYCIDMVQIRNSLGFTFVLIGIHQILKNKIGKEEYVKFCFFVIIGSLIHFSNIFFLLLLLSNRVSIKKNFKVVIYTALLLIIIAKANLFQVLGEQVIGKKIDDILGRTIDYSSVQIKSMIITVIISFVLLISTIYIAYRNTKIASNEGSNEGKEKNEFVTLIMNSQIMLFTTVLIIPMMPDIYRIQRYGVLLNYLGCSKYEISDVNKKVMNSFFYNFLTIIISVLLFYLQIQKLGNFESTFMSLMTNNKFL